MIFSTHHQMLVLRRAMISVLLALAMFSCEIYAQVGSLTTSNSLFSSFKSHNNCPVFETRICGSNEVIVLDSISMDGIKGYWTPQLINTDTIIGKQFSSRWQSIDISVSCSIDTIINFTIVEPEQLNFSIPTSLCKKFGIYLLPKFSLDSISGFWNINRVNTDTLTLGLLPVTFISNDFCVDTFKTSIEIKEFVVPEFDITTKICISDAPFDLPLTSLDGVSGIWTERTIIPSIIGSSFVSIFTPDVVYRDCYIPLAVVFEVYNSLKPEFTFPENVCYNNQFLDFLNVSENNITGTWGIPNIDISSMNRPVLRNTFVPDNNSCHEILVIEIPVITFSHLSLEIADPSNCEINDGIITVLNNRNNDEFSINGGNSWQSIPKFNNLAPGNYTIHFRVRENKTCIDSLMGTILEPVFPSIISVQVSDLTDCVISNGAVNCTAVGENLEFSLDDVSYQSSPTFQNLPAGNYNIFVRNSLKKNCKSSTTFELNTAQKTEIIDVEITDLTTCTSGDGSIMINATGQNVIYSIDNGLTFQQSSQFANLPFGNYQIIVSSSSLMNCKDDTLVIIRSPSLPSIKDIIKENPTDCGLEDGKIILLAEGEFLEYSIDNGMSWSDISVFTNLSFGNYQAIIRNKNAVDCFVSDLVFIDTLKQPIILNIDITQPTTCISNDGKIKIDIDNPNTEFTIDNGLTWLAVSNIQDLEKGIYNLSARVINTSACMDSISFEIIEPPCPCLSLELDKDVKLVHCQDSLTGSIKINQINGFFTNENFDFMWCNNGLNNFEYTGLAQGWYCYTIEYDRNCKLQDSVFVGTVAPIEFDLVGFNETCTELGELEVINVSGGSGSYQYTLDGLTFQLAPSFKDLSSQSFNMVIKDSLGCSTQKEILIEKIIDLEMDLPEIPPIPKGGFGIFMPVIYPSEIDSFVWSPTEYINNPNQLNAEVSPPKTQEYTLTIYNGTCKLLKTVLVEVLPSEEIFFPNILSINSLSGNNLFYLKTDPRNDTTISFLKIYDRWGNLVFQKRNLQINNVDDAWDGTFEGNNVDSGVFQFISEISVNGKFKFISGSITIIK